MKAYSLFIYIICCIYRYTFFEIKPELKKNILKFGYGINYKYEGMLAHSFDRFYVVTKLIFAYHWRFKNKLIYLEDSMVMYGVYSTEPLEKLKKWNISCM